jgi:hypothetical protein
MKKELDPPVNPLSLGNLAISKGMATPDQVASAVKKQEELVPIGEVMVSEGTITREQLKELLEEQSRLKSKSRSHMTKVILEQQRGRIKDVSRAFEKLSVVANKFANGKT